MPGVDQAADHDQEQHILQSGRARRQGGDYRHGCSRYARGGTAARAQQPPVLLSAGVWTLRP